MTIYIATPKLPHYTTHTAIHGSLFGVLQSLGAIIPYKLFFLRKRSWIYQYGTENSEKVWSSLG